MKRILYALLFLSFLPISSAQNLSITSFRFNPTDQTANTAGTIRMDLNGNKCALIKVVTTQTGFSFDVGQLGVVGPVERKPGEYWVYVPAGVKRINISHDKLGSIRDYDLGCTLQAARTYVLEVKSANVKVIVEEQVNYQWLVMTVKPSNAVISIEGPELESTIMESDGEAAQKYLKFGTYKYKVQAADYHTQEGTVTVNDPDGKHVISVELQPAFGYISVPSSGNLEGATVSVDNNIIGNAPIENRRLSSGTHSLVISKPKYRTYTTDIVIEDGRTFTVGASLDANFSSVTVSGIEGSEIWVNGVRKGTSPWTGELEYGSCLLECRKESHRPSTKSFDYTADSPSSITLPAPTPIYGSANISCTPTIADVSVDGKSMGTTPLSIRELLVGTHTIRITKDGYGEFSQTVTISEGKTETITAKLQNSVKVSLSTTDKNASITLDGHQVESLSSVTSLSLGSHTISITASGFKPFERTFTVSADATVFTFTPEATKFSGKTEKLTVNGVSFKMIAVEGGPSGNFHIGETEVTQELWEAVMGVNPSYFKSSQNPVENVSWNDCQEFITKLNSLTGRNFRLPTEAEWEYAAKGGNKSHGYEYSGSDNFKKIAWYDVNSGDETHPVKTKSPNELGIYDMSGNVLEWCDDWYDASDRVYRGGCWYYIASYCRVSFRGGNVPTDRFSYLGLRLAF